MKYPESHKETVNQRLRERAAAQFREKGVDGVSVKSVMAAEGMTVGGFYAHFDSKKTLLIEALKSAFKDSEEKFYKVIEHAPDDQWLLTMISLYLSDFHRDHLAYSCPLSSLIGDVARQDEDVRRVFQEGMEQMLDTYKTRVASADDADAESLAIGLAALLAGGIQLARSVVDKDMSKKILESCMLSAQRMLNTPPLTASRQPV